jgi:RND family efflux transporter MFP subunit
MIFKKKTLYIILIVLFIAIAALILIRGKTDDAKVNKENSSKGQDGNALGSPSSDKEDKSSSVPVKVKVEKVIAGDLIKRVSAYGNAEAQKLVKITPETSGKVIKMFVKEGDRVSKNTVLFKLDTTDAQLSLKRAKNDEIKAYSEFLVSEMDYNGMNDDRNVKIEQARKRLDEAKKKFESGSISKKEYEQVAYSCELTIEASSVNRGEVVKSRTGLTGAKLSVESAELEIKKKNITAPFDGTVTDIKIVEGKNVNAGEESMTIVDYKNIKIAAEVLENEIPALKVGRKVKIDFLAIEGKIYGGLISAISPLIDSEKKTGKVYINIPNSDLKIKPGMYARIRLDAHIFGGRLLVPRAAVLERDGKRLVFVIKNGRAQWEYVRTGLENEEYIEIIPDSEIGILGVHEGDMVITDGHFSLAHDVKVSY